MKARNLYPLALAATLAALALASPRAQDNRRLAAFTADPATVVRHEAGYRYPQAGWIVLHIEGTPRARGRQHGRLLASEIADYIATCASMRSTKAPAEGWSSWRTMTDAWFLRSFDREWLEEMQGIAEGAAEGGATFAGRRLDLLDIVTLNCVIELDFLENALPATPNGLEKERRDHCSAFAATGPATADGRIVFGHITMWSVAQASRFNVWLDVKPDQGHRVGLQTFPGGIWSGTDYYWNDAGLLLTETTIGQTGFERQSKPLAQRARQAMQHTDGIDAAVKVLSEGNNGLYSNEWLLADTKTEEIAMFELGTKKSRLWRSSRKEWLAGCEGFYWGCNNAKELEVRLETIADPAASSADLTWRPSDRDLKWLELFDQSKGKIDAEFAFAAFTTPPLCASHSLDVKFTTAALAKEGKTWALFGPPIGPAWQPTQAQKERNLHARALVGNDWTVIAPPLVIAEARPTYGLDSGGAGPLTLLKSGRVEAVDAADGPVDPIRLDAVCARACVPPAATPAWQGVLLAATDADVWLAAGSAAYERVVAHEPLPQPPSPMTGVSDPDSALAAWRERIEREIEDRLFPWRSCYALAVRRLGHNVALAELKADPRQGDWHHLAAGKGVLVLHELRKTLGPDKFTQLMRTFGAAHAGQKTTTAEFIAAAEKVHGSTLRTFFDRMLKESDQPPVPTSHVWSITSFEEEPERSLIVYGTRQEARANREAAEVLQRQVAARWHNFAIPIRSDQELTDAEIQSHHVVLIGRPACNAVTERLADALPMRFGPASFTLAGVTHGHAGTAVIAAASRPQFPRWSVVLYAGLSADATWRSVRLPGASYGTPCEALLLEAGQAPRPLVLSR